MDGAGAVSPARELDDPSRFDRPRRHTRPRTKIRPSHDEAVTGLVVTVDRGRFTVHVADARTPHEPPHVITAMKSRPLGRQGVVVGDKVRVVGDITGAPGSLARIVDIEPRTTVLRRTADDTDPVERIVVANATQLVVVTSVTDPEPRPRLIDRALVAAYDAGLDPLLCVTKSDLADPEELLAVYRPLGVPFVAVERSGDLGGLRSALRDRASVLVGHSGVGKSTLVNALVPGATRTTGTVNAVTGRGRHTSTSVYALELPFGGWVIDTPGIRSFGLAHVDPRELIGAFDDLQAVTVDCPRGCTHGATEPECALDDAVLDGRVDAERVGSFRRLLASRESTEG
jgi:ribosome biogenesis GTPase / thiamine phosphate phosphatase